MTQDELNRELFDAATTGTAQLVQKYLALGAEPNYQDAKTGLTCLHSAVRSNGSEAVVSLLEYGADPNARNSEGETPLLRATRGKYPNQDVLRHLLAAGADPDMQRINAEGQACEAPLHNCAKNDAKEGILLLLQSGADSTLVNAESGNTPYEDVNMFFKAVQKPFHIYNALPAIDLGQPFTRADLLQSDSENRNALDNPRTWRHITQINTALRIQGEEPIGKAELLGKHWQGDIRAAELLKGGLLRPVAQQLQAGGEAFDVADFLHTPQLEQELQQPEVLRLLFCPENYARRGLEAFERNLSDLPAEARDQVKNQYSLRLELQRQERATATRGR